MRLQVEKKDLLEALTAAMRFAEAKSVIPVLTAFHLQLTEEGALIVTGTDLDGWAHIEVNYLSADGPGEAVVNAKALMSAVKSLKKGTLELQTTTRPSTGEGRPELADRLLLQQGTAEARLTLWQPDDFPLGPNAEKDLEGAIPFSMKLGDLQALLRRVLHASSEEESRFQLNGILLTPGKAGITAAATNGHCLAVAVAPGKALALPRRLAKDDRGQRIVPRRVAEALPHLPGSPEDVVYGNLGSGRHRLHTGSWEVWGRNLKGTFPDYERAIAKDNPNVVRVNRANLLEAAKDAASFLKNSRAQALTLTFNGTVKLEGQDSDSEAEFSREVPLVKGLDEVVRLGINPAYLRDTLASCTEDEMTLRFRDENTQIVLEPCGCRIARHSMVIMPMRI